MTAQQRKALQRVVLEAGACIADGRDSLFGVFSCVALAHAFRTRFEHDFSGGDRLAKAYWIDLLGGTEECETVGDRTGFDDFSPDAREVRLLMLALLHTLISTGDFEDITDFQP